MEAHNQCGEARVSVRCRRKADGELIRRLGIDRMPPEQVSAALQRRFLPRRFGARSISAMAATNLSGLRSRLAASQPLVQALLLESLPSALPAR